MIFAFLSRATRRDWILIGKLFLRFISRSVSILFSGQEHFQIVCHGKSTESSRKRQK